MAKQFKQFKCDLESCHIQDGISDIMVQCKGFCKRKVHGLCLNAPRNWYSSFLSQYFVCEECLDYYGVLRTLQENLLKEFAKSSDLSLELQSTATNTINQNSLNFNEMAKNYDTLNTSVTTLLGQYTNYFEGNFKQKFENFKKELISAVKCVINDTISENTSLKANNCKSTATSTDLAYLTKLSVENFENISVKLDNLVSASIEILDETQHSKHQLQDIQCNVKFNNNKSLNQSICEAFDKISEISTDSSPLTKSPDPPNVESPTNVLTTAGDANNDLLNGVNMEIATTKSCSTTEVNGNNIEIATTKSSSTTEVPVSDIHNTQTATKSISTSELHTSNTSSSTSIACSTHSYKIYISNLSPNTTESSLKNYIKRKFNCDNISCKLITPYRLKYKPKFLSFKVSVPDPMISEIKNPDKWRKGTIIKDFVENIKIKDKIESAIPSPSQTKTKNANLNNKNKNKNKSTKMITNARNNDQGRSTLNMNNKYPNFTYGGTVDRSSRAINITPLSHQQHQYNRYPSQTNLTQSSPPSLLSLKLSPPDLTTSPVSQPTQPYTLPSSLDPHAPAFDPMFLPVAAMTKKLADIDDGHYVLSRLRDAKILENVRLYLAYLHKQSDSVCVDGKTKANLKVLIRQEGLPTDPILLRDIYARYFECYDVSPQEAFSDLEAYASHISTKRINYLQKSREANKYFR